jgi:hypothetical protein
LYFPRAAAAQVELDMCEVLPFHPLFLEEKPLSGMFPVRFAAPVPRAGIKTSTGESVAQCMISDSEFRGPDAQVLYRSHRLGDPGLRLHPPGVFIPDPPANLSFGIHTPEHSATATECLHFDPPFTSAGYEQLRATQESTYHRHKQRLGQVPAPTSDIPPDLLRRGFGMSTRFGESVGAIVQQTHQSVPDDVTLRPGYQTNRNYDWHRSGINPLIHTFGRKGSGNIDRVAEVFAPNDETHIVATAVDRVGHGALVRDPDPIDPKPRLLARTMVASQLVPRTDPAALPPAGLGGQVSEFTVGDTITGMGTMEAFDRDYEATPKGYNPADELRHGLPTKPNPFPTPLRGPGKYAHLRLADEEFLLLRDKDHIVPVMVQALGLTEEEATRIFDRVAEDMQRPNISVAEFYHAFRAAESV